MDQAIRSAAQLRERGLHINMSVNLSASLLDHSDLVGTIRVMLTAHHLPPEILTIEITETAQIENSRQARQTLAPLRSEEHTSELPSLMRISYAVFCLKKKTKKPSKQH